jgi:subtilisin-like proprotein convertase family protein
MSTALRTWGGALLLLAAPVAPALAQTTVTETQAATPNEVITDDGYIGLNDGNNGTGTDAGMSCTVLDFSASEIVTISEVTMNLAVTHSWIGDLVVKVVSPNGTILAPLNRPGYVGPDDGTGGVGDSADLSSGAPITFDDDAPKGAESMGDESTNSAYTVCANAPFNCDYSPQPNGAFNSVADFSGFDGENATGQWAVCVGDAAPIDQGVFSAVSLSITGETEPPPPTCPVDFAATVNTTSLPSNGGTLVFTVSATNNGASAAQLVLGLSATGPINYTRTLGSGTLAAGASITQNVPLRVPRGAPNGTYDVTLVLSVDGDVCDTESFVITKGTTERVVAAELTKAEVEAAQNDRPAASESSAPVELFSGVTMDPNFFASATTAPSAVVASPNPFASRTALSFTLAQATDVRLSVYDVLGREVATLVSGRLEAGSHTAAFDASALSAGTYVYRLVVDGEVETGRITLAR